MNNSTRIIVYHHLGLGDHFICNGLVNHIANQFTEIVLPCWRHNFHTVQSLYSHNPKVTILAVDREPNDITMYAQKRQLQVLPIGFNYLANAKCIWYDAFYEQYNVPKEFRFSYFSLPDNLSNAALVYDQVVESPNYILVHNGSSELASYPIDILQGRTATEVTNIVKITPNVSNNLLDWIKVIQNAREIHAVNSSIFWLLDCMPNLNCSLYYHDIRNGDPIMPTTKWKFINYAGKI